MSNSLTELVNIILELKYRISTVLQLKL